MVDRSDCIDRLQLVESSPKALRVKILLVDRIGLTSLQALAEATPRAGL
jgi:hypothetical protein